MTDNEKKLLNSIKELQNSFYKVNEVLDIEDNFSEDISNGYPFDLSFDELCLRVNHWYCTLIDYYESGRQKHTCSICKKEFVGWGNNPYPVTKGEHDRCCDDCNYQFVIPARLNQELMPLEKGE